MRMRLLVPCPSIMGKSTVQWSSLGCVPQCTALCEMGVAAGAAIENRDRFIRFKAASLPRPSPSERLIAHSVPPSVRPSSTGGGVEWSKSRTVSYSSRRRHGAIIAPTPTTARSTEGDGDVCGAKDVFVHSVHNSRTACNASAAAKTMRCPNTACIVPMLSPFPLQLNLTLLSKRGCDWRSDQTIKMARFPWVFFPGNGTPGANAETEAGVTPARRCI